MLTPDGVISSYHESFRRSLLWAIGAWEGKAWVEGSRPLERRVRLSRDEDVVSGSRGDSELLTGVVLAKRYWQNFQVNWPRSSVTPRLREYPCPWGRPIVVAAGLLFGWLQFELFLDISKGGQAFLVASLLTSHPHAMGSNPEGIGLMWRLEGRFTWWEQWFESHALGALQVQYCDRRMGC